MNKIFLCLVMALCTAVAQDKHSSHQGHNHSEHHNEAHHWAPIGVMGSHLHGEGELMFSYRLMFMEMEGLRNLT